MLWPYIAVIFAYMAPFPDMVKSGVGQRGDWRLSKRSLFDVSRAVERRLLEAEAKSSLRVLMDVTRPLTTFKLKRIQDSGTPDNHSTLEFDAGCSEARPDGIYDARHFSYERTLAGCRLALICGLHCQPDAPYGGVSSRWKMQSRILNCLRCV